MTGQRFTREQVAEWVRASCAEQGLPVVVSDPEVIRDVAVLATGRLAEPADRKRRARTPVPLPAVS